MDFDAFKLHPATSKIVYIIRGLPGSGKTTLARLIAACYHTEDWFEADMYFDGINGYEFKPELLGDAHEWCFKQFTMALDAGSRCVIISNTSSRLKEFTHYMEYAYDMGYEVQVIECQMQFGSIHDVPDATIAKMRARWEAFHG